MISFEEVFQDEYFNKVISKFLSFGFTRDELYSELFVVYDRTVKYRKDYSEKDTKEYILMAFVNQIRTKIKQRQKQEQMFLPLDCDMKTKEIEYTNETLLTDDEIEYLLSHRHTHKALVRKFKKRGEEILKIINSLRQGKNVYKKEKRRCDMLTKNELWWFNLIYRGKKKKNTFTDYIVQNIDKGIAEEDVDCFARAYSEDSNNCKNCILKEECAMATDYYKNVAVFGRNIKDVFTFNKFEYLREKYNVKSLDELKEKLENKKQLTKMEELAMDAKQIELSVDCFGFYSMSDLQCEVCPLKVECRELTEMKFGDVFDENEIVEEKKESTVEKIKVDMTKPLKKDKGKKKVVLSKNQKTKKSKKEVKMKKDVKKKNDKEELEKLLTKAGFDLIEDKNWKNNYRIDLPGLKKKAYLNIQFNTWMLKFYNVDKDTIINQFKNYNIDITDDMIVQRKMYISVDIELQRILEILKQLCKEGK